MMARSQGAAGIGPVEDPNDLPAALKEAVQSVRAGNVCVVDARVIPGDSA